MYPDALTPTMRRRTFGDVVVLTALWSLISMQTKRQGENAAPFYPGKFRWDKQAIYTNVSAI